MYRRGQVWEVRLDPSVGREMKGPHPAVIVSDDAIGILPLKVIVPITDWKERYTHRPWMVRIEPGKASGLTKLSAADAFQVKSVSEERFLWQRGRLPEATMWEITRALSAVLSIEPVEEP